MCDSGALVIVPWICVRHNEIDLRPHVIYLFLNVTHGDV